MSALSDVGRSRNNPSVHVGEFICLIMFNLFVPIFLYSLHAAVPSLPCEDFLTTIES